MSRVASFHLVSERRARALLSLPRLATDRRPLRSVDGLAFVRLLGTARGARTAMSIDPRRTAVFAVWDDEAALDDFLLVHPIAARWRRALASPLRSNHPLDLFRRTRNRRIQLYLAAILLENPLDLPGWLAHRATRDRRPDLGPLADRDGRGEDA